MKLYLYLNVTNSFRNNFFFNILYILHIDDVEISVFHFCSAISSIRRCSSRGVVASAPDLRACS